MKKTIQILTVTTFVGFLSFMGYKTLTKKPVEYSSYEYRSLSQKPDFSMESLTEGTYTSQFESFFQDQFYKRIGISKYFYTLQMALDRPVVSNVLLGENGWAIGAPGFARDEAMIQQSITEVNQLNEFAKTNDIPLYLSIAPYKNITMKHVFPHHPASFRALETKKEVLEALDKSVQIIDNATYFKETFSKEELESMFYKTDHHWNYLGGYENYKNLIRSLQKNHSDIPAPLEEGELIKICADGEKVSFLGSTNRSVLRTLSVEGEAICAYTVPDENVFSEIYSINYRGDRADGLYNVFHTFTNESPLTYGGLTSGDFPLIVMKTQEPPNDYKVLVLKDSYTNAMFPYMGVHFKETHIMDMRHYKDGSVEEYVKENGINLIILSHHETMIGDTFKYSGHKDSENSLLQN